MMKYTWLLALVWIGLAALACQEVNYSGSGAEIDSTPAPDGEQDNNTAPPDTDPIEPSNNDTPEPPDTPDDPPDEPEPPPVPPEPPAGASVLLIQDGAPASQDETPGADIDAAGLIKSNGQEFFADVIVNDLTEIPCGGAVGNIACDGLAALGPPDVIDDEGCFGGGGVDPSRFVSLGGGFITVGFSSPQGLRPIENGDAIHVYEVGAAECGRFDDDPFVVTVSVGDGQLGVFVELGRGGDGNNIIPVSGL